jgi:hypothetical protein
MLNIGAANRNILCMASELPRKLFYYFAQLVQKQATGWTAGVRFPVGQDFFFCIASRPALGPTKPRIQWGSFPGGKAAGA